MRLFLASVEPLPEVSGNCLYPGAKADVLNYSVIKPNCSKLVGLSAGPGEPLFEHGLDDLDMTVFNRVEIRSHPVTRFQRHGRARIE